MAMVGERGKAKVSLESGIACQGLVLSARLEIPAFLAVNADSDT